MTGVTASQWLPVRLQAEGLTLMWLTHAEAEVRAQALTVLKAFSEPVFDQLENAKGKAPQEGRLVYILQKISPDSPDTKWSPVLQACSPALGVPSDRTPPPSGVELCPLNELTNPPHPTRRTPPAGPKPAQPNKSNTTNPTQPIQPEQT